MNLRTIGKALGSLLLLGHFSALLLNNLPWSPFVEVVFPYYSWYVQVTGQTQGWCLYCNVLKSSPDYVFLVTYADGTQVRPWGTSNEMSTRRLYFLEALHVRQKTEPYAKAFFQRIYDKAAPDRKPIQVALYQYYFPFSVAWDSRIPSADTRPAKVLQQVW